MIKETLGISVPSLTVSETHFSNKDLEVPTAARFMCQIAKNPNGNYKEQYILRSAFVFTTLFSCKLRNSKETFRIKMWPEIKKLLLLGLSNASYKKPASWDIFSFTNEYHFKSNLKPQRRRAKLLRS